MPSEDIKLPFSTVKDPREFWIYVYIVTSAAAAMVRLVGGKRESYRGGRMRLGEIEFAIIPSEECGVEEFLLYSDDIPRLLLLLLGFDM